MTLDELVAEFGDTTNMEELTELRERIEELEHELDSQRDNDGYIVVEGVYEEM